MVSAALAVDWRADRVVATIDRPERRNALDRELIADLHALLDRLADEPRLLILSGGTGGTFASGADIGELLKRDRTDALAAINLEAFERLRATPMPTIAAVDGHALGGGAELAYACDLRIASTRARFGQPEAQLGIMAAAGGCYRLPALVGEALAKEVLLAGRILDANDALGCRLVSEVVEPAALLDAAHALADRVLKAAPLALRLTKQAVNAPSAAHPDLERAAQAILFESSEKRARMRAFLARRR
jgi:enoyl-CoA hydratase/carnithine racemase